MLAFAESASAQEQERKLMDRLLKPDMALQNHQQEKQFVARGSTTTKQARTKDFYVPGRRFEKQFGTGAFRTKEFGTKASRDQGFQANLPSRTQILKTDVPYSTAAYRHADAAREQANTIDGSEFSGTRPFLIEGKSQKVLSQKDRPLTIDEVRELLNKNK